MVTSTNLAHVKPINFDNYLTYKALLYLNLKDDQSSGGKSGRVRMNINCTTTEYNI